MKNKGKTSAKLEATTLLLDDELELDELTNVKGIKALDNKRAKESISYFAFWYLGIKPQRFQHMIFKEIEKGNKRLAVVASRQIGKSLAYQVAVLWAAFYDKFPTGSSSNNQNTKIVVVSRSDEQAKKFMNDIRNLMFAGDARLHDLTGGSSKEFFTRRIDTKKENTKTAITLLPRRGSSVGPTIKCFPPTGATRGETANILVIDEAGWVDDDVYNEDIKKVITRTNGLILLSSTPNGQKGFFFQTIDPFDQFKVKEYKRFCFPWQVCEDDRQIKMVNQDLEFAEKTGNMRSFRQEYECSFEANNQAYLSSEKIDEMVDDLLALVYEYKDNQSVLAIDYGMTNSRTVVTISTKESETKPYRLLYQKEFPSEFDESELLNPVNNFSIEALSKRFNFQAIVVDDCPQGYTTNKQLEAKGYYVLKFNFRSDQADRNRGYSGFRSLIHQEKIRMPEIEDLTLQMKQLEVSQGKIHESISKPKGGRDDRVDSFMMSLYPWILEELGDEGFSTVESEKDEKIEVPYGRVDTLAKQLGLYDIQKSKKEEDKIYKDMKEEYELWHG
jgi:hypothetical protein